MELMAWKEDVYMVRKYKTGELYLCIALNSIPPTGTKLSTCYCYVIRVCRTLRDSQTELV
jgi:hypothetical protein